MTHLHSINIAPALVFMLSVHVMSRYNNISSGLSTEAQPI